MKTLNTEIESYNKQLLELDIKERDLLKSASTAVGGLEQRKEKKELQKANNAMKTVIHQKMVVREKERYDL